MRLEKWVASWGGLTRKQARGAIKRGRVTVAGELMHRPAESVPLGSEVRLDGELLQPPPRLLVFHKPVGIQCTVGDSWGRESLEEWVGEALARGLHPVGRLDADSSGVLLLSSDGALTQRLLHPRHGVVKRYEAQVEGLPDPVELTRLLAEGVQTSLGTHSATVEDVQQSQVVLSVTEGKNRMVRRVLANVGHPVLGLRRLSFGPVTLGELGEGETREPSEAEAAWLDELMPR